MAILGRPQGIFDLKNSDMSIGSFLTKSDIKEFLGVNDGDISFLKFRVIEGIEVVKKVTSRSFNVIEAERRPGDPATLVADSTLARSELNWVPEYDDLSVITQHAWEWEMSHFNH